MTALQTLSDALFGNPPSAGFKPSREGVNLAFEQLIQEIKGNVITSSANVRTAAETYDRIIIDEDIVITEVDDTYGYYDCTITGKGSLKGLYRKNVIPDDAPSDHMPASDLQPHQLPALNAASAPIVVLVGDSISTNRANSWGSGGMLTSVLERFCREQAGPKVLSFYNRAIGGQTFAQLDDLPIVTNWPEWYTNHASTWLSYIEALSPDVVFLAFGMNPDAKHLTALRSVVDKMLDWTKVPDIVFCTNLVPSPSIDNAGWDTIADQEARDQLAGLTRSYARFYGYGLLDFHRKECMARDGFDPTVSVFKHGLPVNETAAGATGVWLATSNAWDYRARIAIQTANLTVDDVGSHIAFKIGQGVDDTLFLFKGTTGYPIKIYTGNGGGANDAAVEYVDTVLTLVPNGSGIVNLEIERVGNFLTIRDMTTNVNSGEFIGPVWSGKILSRGGRYIPQLTRSALANGSVLSVEYDIGEPRLNHPSIKNSALWGTPQTGDFPFIGPYGGSRYNHPSDYVASHIYDPVLRSTCLFQ